MRNSRQQPSKSPSPATILAPMLALLLASCATPPAPPLPPSPERPEPEEVVWESPQINSDRPRVIEYDGDDSDSRGNLGLRGGWGQLDEDLGASGADVTPIGGWIRN